jgi:hypothetical protein
LRCWRAIAGNASRAASAPTSKCIISSHVQRVETIRVRILLRFVLRATEMSIAMNILDVLITTSINAFFMLLRGLERQYEGLFMDGMQ